MRRKTVSGIMLTVLLIGMLILTFSIEPVEASGTIYIRADGSIEPPTANIMTVDNITYTFTGNNYDEIVVERSNIIVDGNGYSVQGSGIGFGFNLTSIDNVTIKNMEIKAFSYSIWLDASSNNSISGNNITNNVQGITLWYSSNNSIVGNSVTNNLHGILTHKSNENTISNNTVTDNEKSGILLEYSKSNILRNNSMSRNKYNFGVWATDELSYFINDIDTSNTVDGKLVYYFVNQNNFTIDFLTCPNIGYLGLINSTKIVVKDVNFISNNEGVLLAFTNNSTVENVTLLDNFFGVHLIGNHNLICHNHIEGSNSAGILLDSAKDNLIDGNNITNNNVGIFTWTTDNNTITGNNISNNHHGINFASTGSNNNLVYHNNFINNTMHVYVGFTVTNIWDNGYPSGGNYWSDYTGVDVKSGPNQDQPSSDGIGDIPYVIDTNNTDHYPLMYPWGAPPPPSYTLTIYSSPSGVTFTVSDIPRTTPWSENYTEGASVNLVMAETHNGYVWSYWLEDGDTNRTKTVTMNTNIKLTGVFTFVPPNATVDIDPDTLNLKSKGKWITCYIELPEGYNTSDVDRATILLNGTIPVDPFWVDKPLESVIGDYDDDGIPDLMVKFSRAAVIEYLLGQNITYGKITLTVIGELYDGTSFEGSDMIRVKMPSDVNSSCDECVDNYKLVVPEFPSFLILPLFMIATLLAVIVYKRKRLCNIRFSLKQTIKIS